ncbi:glutamate--cysteine ligase [Dipsacomyces acuminosporus]|nr:glutamate--cysteine ligase [Dipsacomyces acuminosporus]
MGYLVVKRDDAAKRILLSTRAPEILDELGPAFDPASAALHPRIPSSGGDGAQIDISETCWRPAHARFAMRLHHLVFEVPASLRRRRQLLKGRLQSDEMLLSLSQYPLLGSGEYILDQGIREGPLLRSKLLSDNTLNPIPPFTLEINGIIDRRGNVPYTAVPIYRDANTKWPFIDGSLPPIDKYSVPRDRTSGRGSACLADPAPQPLDGEPGFKPPASSPDGARGTQTAAKDTDGGAPPEHIDASNMSLEPTSMENCLLLDSPLYGIGSGGVLRVTLCAADLDEARTLYDQLAPISAILMALTAATPIVKGYLTGRDCYWDAQCSAVDDRTAQERGIIPLTTAKGLLQKSRFGSVDSYLGPAPSSGDTGFRTQFNDCTYHYDNYSYWRMREGGIDSLLAQHVSHLFVRDLHYASARMLREKDEGANSSSDGQEHFKRFLGCNRHNICLYPPNTRTDSGWEVELVSLEAQLTDEENAALITFVVLLSRAILSYRLNLYLPISMMDQNMTRAQKIDAVNRHLFYFRRDPFGGRDRKLNGPGKTSPRDTTANDSQCGQQQQQQQEHHFEWNDADSIWNSNFVIKMTQEIKKRHHHQYQHQHQQNHNHNHNHNHSHSHSQKGKSTYTPAESSPDSTEYAELTVDEIINGSNKHKFVGLLKIINAYLSSLCLEYDVEIRLRKQLALIEMRASGKLCTLATWMRKFVHSHPDYQHDSTVSPSVNYDLLRTLNDIEEGRIEAPELLG